MKNKKYKLELTHKQLSVIQEACEFMSRFSAGQFQYFPPSLINQLYKKWGYTEEYYRRREIWDIHLKYAKNAMFDFDPNESLGIGSPELSEEAKICYDIYRPILEEFDQEYQTANPDNLSYSVYSHEGLSYSKEGRITIKTE